MKRFGVVIKGIKLYKLKKPTTFFIGFLSLIRQVVLSFGVVYFRKSSVFLIVFFNTTSLFVTAIIFHFQPYEDKIQQYIKICQEIGLLIINYQLFCFTGWADPEAAIFLGNWTIYILMTEIVAFLMIGVTPLILH